MSLPTLESRPANATATAAVLAVTLLWGALRLGIFNETTFPLTFVLPLMLCIWTRRAWQLWSMAGIFALMAAVKFFWILPAAPGGGQETYAFLATLLNILIGGAIVYSVMVLRDHLDARSAEILQQNHELEAQTEELFQQNGEIRAQAEELAQQTEEIEAQAEELSQQNEDLQHTNRQLAGREEVLQAVVQHARSAKSGGEALEEVCRRALAALGQPAEGLAVLELSPDGDALHAAARVTLEGSPPLPAAWPVERSLAALVLKEDRTAYVDDLEQRRDLASPFMPGEAEILIPAEESAAAGKADGAGAAVCRSLLATPVHIRGAHAGVLAVCSSRTAHWTQDQFQLAEWAAAQCGLLLENHRWQEELQQRADDLEAAGQAKDTFMATLSHELRTPLTPVLVTADALAQDVRLPEDVRDDLRMIRRNVAVQSRLIDDLLDLTRITRGKVDLHLQHLSLISLIQESAAIVAPELDAAELSLLLDLDLPPHCAVTGDGARLQQVFWNLLKNSLKFSPPRGRITLRAVLDHAPAEPVPASGIQAVITITDEGRGIAAEDLERIFKPFEQATASGRRRRGESGAAGGAGGLGLGLSIAQAIMELHDGSLSAASDGPGCGASFTVRLPLATRPWTVPAPASAESPGAAESAAAADCGGPSKPLSILLVEDHADTGRVIARLLTNCGYTVARAETCEQALALWRSQPFGLIVSDLGLPDGSGLDLMRTIRSENADIPGICTSGYGMESDIAESRAAGFCEHLIKPVDMQRLRAAIRRITGSPAEAAPPASVPAAPALPPPSPAPAPSLNAAAASFPAAPAAQEPASAAPQPEPIETAGETGI